ncbi:DUF4115 domain-containing protein [Halovulum dunhuangense]|uniref:DUF4115 domain-containing protein n=1 Tax=Halovulum dunhuangense TaxID=1505036 RepID=A0A849L396_9RHOB|nr:helix-turn-helix domain-containing protein [Halovulum dunhuangense]NNU80816.1 DUF4115 domain-containing protein [Halovulum dunhuangense]
MGRPYDEDADLRGFDAYEVRLGDHLRGERATLGKSLLEVQRDLRIRASYIAAIENCDLAVFPNLGFVAGYVRSYARYLKLDPDEVYRRFCRESGFDGVNAGMQTSKAPSGGRIVASGPLRLKDDDPLLRPVQRPAADLAPAFWERMSLSAVGSLAVLLALTGGVGYGGYRVLENIQRVTIAPVEQRPDALFEIGGVGTGFGEEIELLAQPEPTAVPAAAPGMDLARLYQPRELDVPVVESRDGPIIEIDPAQSALFAPVRQPEMLAIDPALLAAVQEDEPQVREPAGVPVVNVTARQPAWIRVYLSSGTVLFEKILEPGETYTLPQDAEAPLLRAGNSGSVYLLVNDRAFGPLGNATSVAKDVSLLPDDIRTAYAEVTEVPEVIQATLSALALPAE